ncbi:MAG: hypothetical protein LBJ12_02905 [Oscillospiraceae bacterium]|jgi:hypothetical protein|nr:hypothetical protein [Oscillospiraceae bacterium]
MAQESHFRAALFGGFQKSDVLAYIENLQNQVLTLQGEQQQRSREVPAMRAQIQALTVELEQARAREHSFFDNEEELKRQISVIEQDRDDLRNQFHQAKAGQDRVKDVEGQVGTLILDALLYSEKIIARAKETAQIIATRAQNNMHNSAAEVDGLGEDMTRISQDFSESITQLVGRIRGVSADLSGMAEKLVPDLTDGSEQYEFDAEGRPVLREIDEEDNVSTEDNSSAPPVEDVSAPPQTIPVSYAPPSVVESAPIVSPVIAEPELEPAAAIPEIPVVPLDLPVEENAYTELPESPTQTPPEEDAAGKIPGGWFAEAPLVTDTTPPAPPLLDFLCDWNGDSGEKTDSQ